jgi:hypothetical protein
VWETFLALAAIYFVFMMVGALSYRVPANGWKPAGWTAAGGQERQRHDHQRHVHVKRVWGIAAVLAGVAGAVPERLGRHRHPGMASPLLQEVFGGRLIGVTAAFNELDTAQKAQIATIAAGFTGLLSLFNIGGRFAWATCSDYIGRKATYFVFLVLGFVLYSAIPRWRTPASLGCSCCPSASSCRCTAAASRPCRPTWPTCSAPRWWARSTAAC